MSDQKKPKSKLLKKMLVSLTLLALSPILMTFDFIAIPLLLLILAVIALNIYAIRFVLSKTARPSLFRSKTVHQTSEASFGSISKAFPIQEGI